MRSVLEGWSHRFPPRSALSRPSGLFKVQSHHFTTLLWSLGGTSQSNFRASSMKFLQWTARHTTLRGLAIAASTWSKCQRVLQGAAQFYFIFVVLRTLVSCRRMSLLYLKICSPVRGAPVKHRLKASGSGSGSENGAFWRSFFRRESIFERGFWSEELPDVGKLETSLLGASYRGFWEFMRILMTFLGKASRHPS